MATPKTVWGIDIGQVALKALKLRNVEGELQAEAFDIIEHPKILSQPDADRRQLIRSALEQFLARNNIEDSLIALAVPGQSSFTRFVKLPPVEASTIPNIVRYEAEQQIPFPINDVIWRWQTFHDPDSPDIEVGIFAMKRLDVDEMLERFADVGLGVDIVQMAPLSLYNFMVFDGQTAPEGATLLADVGADKTDLVVSDGARMWNRTIQIGGNNFTEALVKAFKLSFGKAEKLKRTAATSKYARQIFQAMRPVFADLVQEIQRSIGFYTALHRETRFKRLIGLGNGFRLPGLQKYLEQNLNIPVLRIDSYNKLTPSPTVNAPTFTENVLSFAVAYGLALQGLQQTPVNTNLLPGEIASQRHWARKRPWFAAAAAALLIALAMPIYRNYHVMGVLDSTVGYFEQAKEKIRQYQGWRAEYNGLAAQKNAADEDIRKTFDLFKYRAYWPNIEEMIFGAFNNSSVSPDMNLYTAYARAINQEVRNEAVKKIRSKPRATREVFFVTQMKVEYSRNCDTFKETSAAGAGGTPAMSTAGGAAAAAQASVYKPGFKITVTGYTPLSQRRVNDKIYGAAGSEGILSYAQRAAKDCKLFDVAQEPAVTLRARKDVESALGGGRHTAPPPSREDPNQPKVPVVDMPDPLLSDEDMADDTEFTIRWIIALPGEKVSTGYGAQAAPTTPYPSTPQNTRTGRERDDNLMAP